MGLRIVTPPAAEPLSLAEVKLYLGVDHSEKDAILNTLIAAARRYAEKLQNRAMVEQTWDLLLDAFPCAEILIPIAPLRSVVGVYYFDTDGIEQPFLDFTVDKVSEPPWVLASDDGWPATLDGANVVRVQFVAGYALPNATADVPPTTRQAMMMLVCHWFEQHNPVSEETLKEVPLTVDALLAQDRVYL